jgi:antitoxin HigA-1
MAMMHNPAHPGEVLREYMDGMKLTVTDMAKHLRVSRVSVSRILNGKSGISAGMSLRLSEAFGTSPDLWLKVQVQHYLWVASRKRRARIAPLIQAA